MHQVNLQSKKRTITGKEYSKKIRREGFVPGVIYGKGFENVHVSVDEKELKKALSSSAGTRVILVMNVADGDTATEYTTMVMEIQRDIYQKQYYHIDFQKISLDERVHALIPIILKGDCKGVKEGGMLDQIIRRISIEALPLVMPEKLILDISDMEENDSFKVSDLVLPEGAICHESLDEMICIVHPPRVADEVLEAEAAAAAAPAAEAAPAKAAPAKA